MQVATLPPPPPTTRPTPRRTRQSWLDALRGFAALVVVFEHSLDPLLPEIRGVISPWFDFGQYGVLVFFLVSGYVVPISLERRGDVRAFWITRVFRLYPLWALAAAAGAAFAVAGVYTTLPGQIADRPWTAALAHLTMLQDLLQVPGVVNVFWTLSYEMAFYLLVTAMFVLGARGTGTRASLAFAVGAPIAGALVPAGLLSRGLGVEAVVAVAATVLAGGFAAVLAGRPEVRRHGAVALAVLAVALLALNSRVGAWQSLAIMATMFGGTALHHMERSAALRARWGWAIFLVPVLAVATAVWLGPGWGMPEADQQAFKWSWSTAMIGAWLTFAAGLALRRRAIPPVLAWLGLVSYSIYLLHPLVLQVVRRITVDPSAMTLGVRLAWEAALFAAVVACAALGHRFVERPAQLLGRRLAAERPVEMAQNR
ncbi:acyltransferase [Sphaerisporangium sp. NPDC005289]|uniref:acyltransferase family protein n=1 Tax=Sphaerisporangium sp. NPDC005289 TaxID=3155247 RepID=UPI0033BEC1D7